MDHNQRISVVYLTVCIPETDVCRQLSARKATLDRSSEPFHEASRVIWCRYD
jgi:hypothetical protein